MLADKDKGLTKDPPMESINLGQVFLIQQEEIHISSLTVINNMSFLN